MTVEVLDVDDPVAVDRTIEVLRAGGVVVLPTDTVYGLAASAANAVATAQLFARKGRSADVPLAVLCATAEQAFGLAQTPVGAAVSRLAERHWPGPLTLVLQRRSDLGWSLGHPTDTVGVRCPDHPFIRAVAGTVGPLATTSANRHGSPTPTTAVAAATDLDGEVDLVIDGGELIGTPSTVVDATAETLRVLRQGAVTIPSD